MEGLYIIMLSFIQFVVFFITNYVCTHLQYSIILGVLFIIICMLCLWYYNRRCRNRDLNTKTKDKTRKKNDTNNVNSNSNSKTNKKSTTDQENGNTSDPSKSQETGDGILYIYHTTHILIYIDIYSYNSKRIFAKHQISSNVRKYDQNP